MSVLRAIVAAFRRAGWGAVPTPYQVLGVLMACSTAIPLIGITEPGSLGTKLCELLSLLCGGSGIVSAKNYLSQQVRTKLEAVDARALGDISTHNERGQP